MASTYQDVLDSVALVIGGTKYTANGAQNLYSGYLNNNDGTGVAGIRAAYSAPPAALQDPPVALVLPGPFTVASVGTDEENIDKVYVWVMVSRNDPETQMPNLAPYRDSIPNAFKAKFQIGQGAAAQYNVLNAFILDGAPKNIPYSGSDYLGWEFVLTIRRDLTPTYSA